MASKGTSRKVVNQFFNSELKTLEQATTVVTKDAARKHRRLLSRQLKTRFTEGVHRNPSLQGTFFKAVKIYDLKTDSNKGGPISYVRMGVPFMHVFEFPQRISAKRKSLVILLPPGKALGFQRISKTNPWKIFWERNKKQLKLAKGNGGLTVLYKKDGKAIPIYKIQKSVQSRKLLNFYDAAELAARGMDQQILDLIEGDFNV